MMSYKLDLLFIKKKKNYFQWVIIYLRKTKNNEILLFDLVSYSYM